MSLTKAEVKAIAQRYESRWFQGYVKSKLRTDPLYPAVWNELKMATLPLLDLGCGLGLLAFYLRHQGFEPDIFGIDYDKVKIAAAQRIASNHYPDTRFQFGDVRGGIPDFQGNVTILDILQFFNRDEQARLLADASRAVASGGRLVIRSGLCDHGWRFRVTYAGDVLARTTRWMKAPPTCYPTRESICTVLESEGLEGNVTPLWGNTPFNNYLISYRKL